MTKDYLEHGMLSMIDSRCDSFLEEFSEVTIDYFNMTPTEDFSNEFTQMFLTSLSTILKERGLENG